MVLGWERKSVEIRQFYCYVYIHQSYRPINKETMLRCSSENSQDPTSQSPLFNPVCSRILPYIINGHPERIFTLFYGDNYWSFDLKLLTGETLASLLRTAVLPDSPVNTTTTRYMGKKHFPVQATLLCAITRWKDAREQGEACRLQNNQQNIPN